jgi:very-short-patch-repair endonuclease
MDPYVLDFFCPEKRLAIEVDGGGHSSDEQADRDSRRDRWLSERGIRVVRVRAVEIMQRLDEVMQSLHFEVERPSLSE